MHHTFDISTERFQKFRPLYPHVDGSNALPNLVRNLSLLKDGYVVIAGSVELEGDSQSIQINSSSSKDINLKGILSSVYQAFSLLEEENKLVDKLPPANPQITTIPNPF